MPKKINNFSNLYFKPSPVLGFNTPKPNLSKAKYRDGEKKMSYLSQIKKYNITSHMFDSQISFGYGCTDAEFISLFKMTHEYSKNIANWDKYIKKIVYENYSDYQNGIGCCPVHKISWTETKIYNSFFPTHAPDFEKMLLNNRSNKKYINSLNKIIILINKSLISSLKRENKNLIS